MANNCFVGLRSLTGGTYVVYIADMVVQDLSRMVDGAMYPGVHYSWGRTCEGAAKLCFDMIEAATGDSDLAAALHHDYLCAQGAMGNRDQWVRYEDEIRSWCLDEIRCQTRRAALAEGGAT